MRVIAGELGGRRLRTARGAATRPTAERVREALFSMLGPLEGAAVLDLFAGSGALGIEALSRGAAHATFVECSAPALAALRANLAALELDAERARVSAGDALAALRSDDDKYDLVFLDPPYAQAAALAGRPVARAARGACARARAWSASPIGAPRWSSGCALERERRYGDTMIRIHQTPQA